LFVSVQDNEENGSRRLLGHFRCLGEPLALQLDQVIEVDDKDLFTATLTGLKMTNGLNFSFNPGRKWQYIPNSRGGDDDHLFTVYYVVNGKVRGVAESAIFHLAASSTCPRNHCRLEFNEGTAISQKSSQHPGEANTKTPKLSDNIGTIPNEPSMFDPDYCLSRTLYSFNDKDDFCAQLRCLEMEWIDDGNEIV
jgi:hypothetical protein